MYSVQFQEKLLIFEIFLIEKFCFKILMDFEMPFGDHFLNSKIEKKNHGIQFSLGNYMADLTGVRSLER